MHSETAGNSKEVTLNKCSHRRARSNTIYERLTHIWVAYKDSS